MSFAPAGRSIETVIKPDVVAEITSLALAVIRRIDASKKMLSQNFPFVYVDLTAGPGVHDDGIPGAASVVHGLLKDQPFPSAMLLIERRDDYCEQLRDLLPGQAGKIKVFVRCGDSATVGPDVIKEWPRNPYGIVCFDPNGFGSVEEELLNRVGQLEQLQRMDWLMHLPTRAIKRVRKCADTICNLDLQGILSLTHKRRFLIKRSPVNTQQDWAYFFGTNAPDGTIKEWRRAAWYDCQSDEGRRILRNCTYTIDEQEILQQANLWEGNKDAA
jgi:three-Cys-motif partner protein